MRLKHTDNKHLDGLTYEKLTIAAVCLHIQGPVTSWLVFSTKVVQVKNNGDSCENLEKIDRKWLNIVCNLVQTHLIGTKIEVSYLYLIIRDSSQNASYDL